MSDPNRWSDGSPKWMDYGLLGGKRTRELPFIPDLASPLARDVWPGYVKDHPSGLEGPPPFRSHAEMLSYFNLVGRRVRDPSEPIPKSTKEEARKRLYQKGLRFGWSKQDVDRFIDRVKSEARMLNKSAANRPKVITEGMA